MSNPKSAITGGATDLLFSTDVLGKYEVSYFRCRETGFIQTEKPYWLPEAYSSAITALDLGIISRNIEKSRLTKSIIEKSLPSVGSFLDYGGGYGIFTRLMRDNGYDFRHYDIHCTNLFAKGFDVSHLEKCRDFNPVMITAWEVMEHIEYPSDTLAQILSVSDTFLFSTELVPNRKISGAEDWWYISPEIGQHISFYTLESLQHIAKQFDARLYTDGHCNHLISRIPLSREPFKHRPLPLFTRIQRKLTRKLGITVRVESGRDSLLMSDYQHALQRLRVSQQSEFEVGNPGD